MQAVSTTGRLQNTASGVETGVQVVLTLMFLHSGPPICGGPEWVHKNLGKQITGLLLKTNNKL